MRWMGIAGYLLLLTCGILVTAFEAVTFKNYLCAVPTRERAGTRIRGAVELPVVLGLQVVSLLFGVWLQPSGLVEAILRPRPVSVAYVYLAFVLPVSGWLWICFRYLEHTPIGSALAKRVDKERQLRSVRTWFLVEFLLGFGLLTLYFIAIAAIVTCWYPAAP